MVSVDRSGPDRRRATTAAPAAIAAVATPMTAARPNVGRLTWLTSS
jgi:hypothetical protein